MLSKTKIVLAAALVLGSASGVLASDIDRNDVGGFRVGPLGQSMGGSAVNPVFHPSMSCERHSKATYVGADGVRHPCP